MYTRRMFGFSISSFKINGYGNGDRNENGHYLPKFTKEQIDEIIEHYGLDETQLYYDEDDNEYVLYPDHPEDERTYPGQYEMTEDGPIKLYSLGHGAWNWNEKGEGWDDE